VRFGGVTFDPAVGSEIQKTRPAVIVSNDAANRNLETRCCYSLKRRTLLVFPPGEARGAVAGEFCKAMSDHGLMAADKSG
jgi:mRNA interferase MazF